MKNISEQYEMLLESATEVASACLDMKNGALLLAWSGELRRQWDMFGAPPWRYRNSARPSILRHGGSGITR